ncbi:hypothetical protein AB1Y20_014549 [Prymnesium parvum]|uniref:Protein kinase domain-containing protein n=1 Tax=Prymnesium parvum TaxID=97485 RepID=A0AB34IDN5_PRYPA
MANLEDPKAELKKKGEAYAGYIVHGVPRSRCRPFELPPANAADDLVASWKDKNFWEMWAQSRAHQFFLMQWALQHGSTDLKAVVKFAARVGVLPNRPTPEAKAAIAGESGIGADLSAGTREQGVSKAKEAIDPLHKLTRKLPYDAVAFKEALGGLLGVVPTADITCKEFLETPKWAAELARADYIISQPKSAINFEKAAKPLLVGVGGFGLVQLSFEDQWGLPFALKRQNIYMIMDKKNEDKVILERHMAMQIHSPFVLNASYAYIDNKDLVLALKMMPGGDLSHYVKLAKKKAKDGPPQGLGKSAVQFYVASTVLALEALHEAGYVYRDLKDKNILLDANGYARLCDFGLSHDLSTGPAKGRSGTKGFWAPEQLISKTDTYNTSVDFWTLGVCAYHWATGKQPYAGEDHDEVQALIKKAEYTTTGFPQFDPKSKEFFVPYLRELCAELMTIEPSQRLGVAGAGVDTLKGHPFFNGLDWTKLYALTIKPPIQPTKGEIAADLPSTLKDEFKDWARKPVPENAAEVFVEWTGSARSVVEDTAIEWLDKDPLFFDSEDYRASKPQPLLKEAVWSSTVIPPVVVNTGKKQTGSSQKNDVTSTTADASSATPPNGSSGGCCTIL